VRFEYAALPTQDPQSRSTARPVLAIAVVGGRYPVRCLIDTGAHAIRLPMWVADDAGVGLAGADTEEFWVAGQRAIGRRALVDLRLADWEWHAPVWFCEPWKRAYGLLGQVGFLDRFRITIDGYEQWVDCEPGPSGSVRSRS
jgi:hypothetical protein